MIVILIFMIAMSNKRCDLYLKGIKLQFSFVAPLQVPIK